jgi:hypothetical protein
MRLPWAGYGNSKQMWKIFCIFAAFFNVNNGKNSLFNNKWKNKI